MKWKLALALACALSTTAMADTFTNGNFESGNLAGWTQGGGYWDDPPVSNITAQAYSLGGSRYNASYIANSVVTPGLDANTDNHLNRVYSGNYSAQINDANSNNSVSLLSQTVKNYTDSTIYFAWAAVLQDSHGPDDSDNFILTLTDDTKGLTLYNTVFNSALASTAGLFTKSSTNWYYTSWQVQNFDVSAYAGDQFTLSLLASDCPYGGHAGYVYLDGFGAVLPPTTDPGNPTAAPEPASIGMMAMSAMGTGIVAWKRRKAAKQ